MTLFDVIQTIISFLTNQELIAKLLLAIFISLYLLFAIILAVQIRLLNNIVNQISFSPFFKLLSYLHVVIVITLFLFVILSL